MLNLDLTLLTQVVNSAQLAAANEPRWQMAIAKAAEQLVENPYMERDGGHLLIGSPSGTTYAANGVCQCKAYEHGQPCWHRAAARLVQRYDEAQTRTAKRAAYEQAVREMDELYA